MPRDPVVVALDIGTTKICTLLAEIDQNRQLNVVGVGTAPSAGMRKGVVVNIDEAAQAIQLSVERCERLSGYTIESAFVGITGSHIRGTNRRGVVAVSPNAPEITSVDVDRAMEAARVQAISNDHEIIHVIPRGYTLDGQDGVRDPVGMAGRRLEAEMHIVTGGSSAIRNLVRCVNRAGLQIDSLILQPLASAEAVLSRGEKDIGVAVADVGGGTTDVAVFVDGAVCHTGSFPVAGNHITNDLSLGLRAPFSVAEQVKIQHGSAVMSEVEEADAIEVQTYDQDEMEWVSRRLVAEIIESRMHEIFGLIQAEIARTGYEGRLPAGVVLVGGTADLKHIRILGRDVLSLPVRVGMPKGAVGLTDTVSRPAFATTIGLLRSAAYDTEEARAPTASLPQWKGMKTLRGWLRELRT
jgi:cell division protein FtsA